MILIPLIEKLRLKFQTEQATSEVDWQTIIAKVADGSATEIEITKAMKASGRSLSDLETDVSREQQITGLKAIIARYVDTERERQNAEAAQNEFRSRRLNVNQQLDTEGRSLNITALTAQQNVAEIHSAVLELETLGVVIKLPVVDAA